MPSLTALPEDLKLSLRNQGSSKINLNVVSGWLAETLILRLCQTRTTDTNLTFYRKNIRVITYFIKFHRTESIFGPSAYKPWGGNPGRWRYSHHSWYYVWPLLPYHSYGIFSPCSCHFGVASFGFHAFFGVWGPISQNALGKRKFGLGPIWGLMALNGPVTWIVNLYVFGRIGKNHAQGKASRCINCTSCMFKTYPRRTPHIKKAMPVKKVLVKISCLGWSSIARSLSVRT